MAGWGRHDTFPGWGLEGRIALNVCTAVTDADLFSSFSYFSMFSCIAVGCDLRLVVEDLCTDGPFLYAPEEISCTWIAV